MVALELDPHKRQLTPGGRSPSSSHPVSSPPVRVAQQAAILQLPSPPQTPPIPIPAPNKPKRSSSCSFDSYFQGDYNGDEDQEQEEYEHSKRMYDLQTWNMYHRIQNHRRRHQQQQQEEQEQRNAGRNIGMIPTATMVPPHDVQQQLQATTLVNAVPLMIPILWRPLPTSSMVAVRAHQQHTNAFTLERELSSEDLIFGDLEE